MELCRVLEAGISSCKLGEPIKGFAEGSAVIRADGFLYVNINSPFGLFGGPTKCGQQWKEVGTSEGNLPAKK